MTVTAVTSGGATLEILVPTLGERSALFMRLMSVLLPQTEHPECRAKVVGWFNNGTPSLPVIRQTLITDGRADYVCFVDDDDLVSPDYVEKIMDALATTPDYVGFQVQCYSDGVPTLIAHHSLKHEGWVNESDRYLRDISHINPIRRDIALTADFRRTRAGFPEDREWASQLRKGRRLQSETVIDSIMYHYLYSTSKKPGLGSRWQSQRSIHRHAGQRPVIDHPNFRWAN